MKNQRRFAPTKPGRFAPEQVAAFLRNQWPNQRNTQMRQRHLLFARETKSLVITLWP